MSGTGSPSDQTMTDQTNPNSDTPAGASAEGAADKSGQAGDANLSADGASSAPGDLGAKKDQPKPTLADVIKTAAELKPDGQGKSPAPANDGKDKAVVDANAPPVEKTDAQKAEDDAKLPFHNHPRWKEVIGQNKSLTEKVATLEPAAQQFGKITEFMETNRLNHDEVGEGFIIMAMIKNGDPRGLVKLDDYRNKLAEFLGEKIPTDIQAQIDSGAITEAAGKELSKARAGKANTDAELARKTEADTQRTNTEKAATLARECQSAATAWQVEIQKTDPDFAKKESAIARYSRALMQERGFPKTPADAVKIVKDAYAEVNKDFASVLPAKTGVKRVESAPSSHGATPQPKTLREAIAQAAVK